MSAFRARKPSERAQTWPGFGAELQAGLDGDVSEANARRPEIPVRMGDGANGAVPTGVGAARGGARAAGKVEGGPKGGRGAGAAPRANSPAPTNLPRVQRAAPAVRVSAQTPADQGRNQARNAIAGIDTGVPLNSSAGPRPKVPQNGAADPSRTEQEKADASQRAAAARSAAQAEVRNGRGPESVQPRIVDDLKQLGQIAQKVAEQARPVDGMQQFVDKNLPADVVAEFDESQSAIMDASVAVAEGQVSDAATERDASQAEAISKAQADAEQMGAQASAQQDAAVDKARGDIDAARADTLAEQERATAELDAEVAGRQRAEVDAVRSKVATEEARVDRAFVDAERKAESEIRKGEQEADRKKKEEEEKAKDRSWWDRVKDAVSSVIKAITDFVNAIVERVREAVTAILDGVKKLATELIDACAQWITERLQAFSKWLQDRVTQVLGSVFPELAAALNKAIDAACDWACAKVEKLAEDLKTAVNELCDTLASTIDGLLTAFQAVVNTAMTVLEAALTGDWAKVGKLILEAVLKLAGIPPEEFYATLGQAEESIDIIVDNPGGFVGNLIDSVSTGFGQFGDNFLDHLQGGFLSWMSGQQAEAGIPELKSLELKDIFSFAMDTLGINQEYIREKAVKHLGEENVNLVENVMGFVGNIMQNGWEGVWGYVESYFDGLYEDAIGKIQDFLMEKIVKSAVLKIASMFSPVGAIVQAVITAWNVYEFVRDQSQRIFGIVRSVIDSINDIAHGNIGGAANLVEQSLARLVPVAIDLLAKLLGLGGIGKKVKEVIHGIHDKVDAAIEGLIEKAKGFIGNLGNSKAKPADAAADPAATTPEGAAASAAASGGTPPGAAVGTTPAPAASADGKDAQAGKEAKRPALANGAFHVETDRVYGRDPELGIAGFTIAFGGRVKHPKGESVDDGLVGAARGSATMVVKSVVGKAVNARGVMAVTTEARKLSDEARPSVASRVKADGLELAELDIERIDPTHDRSTATVAVPPRDAKGLDEVSTISAAGETHRVWVTGGPQPTSMMASDPKPVREHVQSWRQTLRELPSDRSKACGQAIGRVIGLQTGLETARAAAERETDSAKRPALDAKVKDRRLELAVALESMILLLPPGLAESSGTASETAELLASHAPDKVFVARYVELARGLGVKDAASQAEQVWRDAIAILEHGAPAMDTVPNATGSKRKDLGHATTQRLMDDLDPIVAALRPLMARFESADTVAFWSGRPGQAVAMRAAGVTLESSGLGRLFDGLDLGPKVRSIQLWAALSRAYASYAAEKLADRRFLGFLGARSDEKESVFNRIEQPTFVGMLDARTSVKPTVTWHSAVMDVDQGEDVPDWKVSSGGFAGTDMSDDDRSTVMTHAVKENERRKRAREAKSAPSSGQPTALGGAPSATPVAGGPESVGGVSAQQPPTGTDSTVDGTGRVGTRVVRGGLAETPLEGVTGTVGKVDGDLHGQKELPVGVPVRPVSGPGTPVGKRDRVVEQESVGKGGGHASSSLEGAAPVKRSSTRVDSVAGAAGFPASGAPEQVDHGVVHGTEARRGVAVEPVAVVGEDRARTGKSVDADAPGVRQMPPVEAIVPSREGAAVRKQDGGGDVEGVAHAASVPASRSPVNDTSKPRIDVSQLSRKARSPKETLAASGEMTPDEIARMEGAIKKDPHSRDVVDARSGERRAEHIAEPQTDDKGKALSQPSNRDADGAVRAPMSAEERDATLKGHAILARDNVAGAPMRKVIATSDAASMLAGQQPLKGAERLGPAVRGSFAHQRNTEGLNAEQTIATLGLDYEHQPHRQESRPATGRESRGSGGNYTRMDAAGRVTMSDEVANKGLHYVDFAMTEEMEREHGVMMGRTMIAGARAHADPAIQQVGARAKERDRDHQDDAYTGTGATASNALQRRDGGGSFDPALNQELMLRPGRERGAGRAAYELPSGAQMKRRDGNAGEDTLIATLRQRSAEDGTPMVDEAGKPLMHWELNAELARGERGTYKNMMDKAASEARATARKPLETDADYDARMDARKARIAEARDTRESESVAAGNPFPPGTSAFKSWERRRRRAAETTAPSAASNDAAVAESITGRTPKPTRPPKDYPEPGQVDGAQSGEQGTAKADGSAGKPRTVAPNPGLRKEHEGTGLEWLSIKGEAFVKGEGDAEDVDANDVRQGSLGDCYLIGGMAAVARANPQYIRDLVRDNGDGTYDVTLYIRKNGWDPKGSPKTVTVDDTFASGDKGASAKYARFGDRGPKGPELWTMLIEKAWAIHKGTYSGIEGGKVNDDGKFAGALALLTNLKEGYYTPASIDDATLANMIADALKKRKPVACDSKNLDKESPELKAAADKAGVVGNHAYAPEKVDLGAMTIDLQNPWGQSHVRGLSIADFKRFYRGLRIAT